jgi:hypothetical protein
MPTVLPDWLEHYREVPSWVLFVSVARDHILWVNDRLATDLGRPREWFRGRLPREIWEDSHARHTGKRALAEKRSIDVIGDGKDLQGRWRWLDARFTPIDGEHLLIVCQDITARIRLSGLRLVLGHGFSTDAVVDLGEQFARRLLAGASLEELAREQSVSEIEVLGKLGKLIGEQQPARGGLSVPATPPVPLPADQIPAWVASYWDLPGPTILLAYPAMTVLWVNRVVLERNQLRAEDVVGVDANSVWHNVADWRDLIDQTMKSGRSIDTVHQGHNRTGKQQWLSVHTTPIDQDRILMLSEDVTADVRLQALRLLLGLNPQGPVEQGKASPSEAFARLLLDGASVANIAAALEMTANEVRGQAALILGRSH